MPFVSMTRTIAAPPEHVFRTISDIREYRKVQPTIVDVEFLTPTHSGVGTRFRETRMMGKRRVSTVLEVAEYSPPTRVRMLSEAGGVLWDTIFTVAPHANPGTTELTMVMEATPRNLLARLMMPMLKGMVTKAVAADLDVVKLGCERRAQ
jgi:uncharacterized protein YndB with AHSA1/START domain